MVTEQVSYTLLLNIAPPAHVPFRFDCVHAALTVRDRLPNKIPTNMLFIQDLLKTLLSIGDTLIDAKTGPVFTSYIDCFVIP
jgi:hypothetical protein